MSIWHFHTGGNSVKCRIFERVTSPSGRRKTLPFFLLFFWYLQFHGRRLDLAGFARHLAIILQTLLHHHHSGHYYHHHNHHHHHHHHHLIHPSWAIASLTSSTSSSTAPLATWSRSFILAIRIISIMVVILTSNCDRKQTPFTVLKPQSKILTFAKTCTAVFFAISSSHQLSSRW